MSFEFFPTPLNQKLRLNILPIRLNEVSDGYEIILRWYKLLVHYFSQLLYLSLRKLEKTKDHENVVPTKYV